MYPYICKKVKGKKYDVHRIVANAQNLGFNNVVHHIDEDKHNNNPDNLTIMTRGEHCKLHGFGTKIMSKPPFQQNADGTFTCRICGKSKEKQDFLKHTQAKYGIESSCRECYNKTRPRQDWRKYNKPSTKRLARIEDMAKTWKR
jgi:hypothetical protein